MPSLLELDRRLLTTLRTRGHGRPVEASLAGYSRLGEHAACWLALGGIGSLCARTAERRRAWRRGMEATAFAYGLNYAVKVCARRPRPSFPGMDSLAPVVSRYSFPSAHATTSFAAAGVYRRVAPASLLYGAATLFCVSRPYLGVHYPSDVVAGAALGTLVAGAWPR